MDIKSSVQVVLQMIPSGIILIHSDLMRGFSIPFKGRDQFQQKHIDVLVEVCNGKNIWMPAFNYDFCRGLPFSVNESPSKVGNLTEYYRLKIGEWRTATPVFSFVGVGEKPEFDMSGEFDPFGERSVFHYLYEQDAVLMHYGSALASTTILHYAERMSGVLIYRYDKIFTGIMINSNEKETEVKLKYHVRPMNRHLDYNWEVLENDLVINGILRIFQEGRTRILICRARQLVDFWVDCMKNDPLYLLDEESRHWIEPIYVKRKLPFMKQDFE